MYLINLAVLFGIDYVSRLAPREYEETSIRLFCRHRNQVELGKKLFQQWRLIYGL